MLSTFFAPYAKMTKTPSENPFKISARIAIGFLIIVAALCLDDRLANAQDEEPSIKDIIEELYTNYEAIDARLRELKRDAEGSTEARLLTPVTITVKKKTEFNLIAIEIKDKNEFLWANIYTDAENAAMDGGTRHQFYKDEFEKGDHDLLISYRYAALPHRETLSQELSWTFTVGDEPIFLELLFEKEGALVTLTPRRLYLIDAKEYVAPK